MPNPTKSATVPTANVLPVPPNSSLQVPTAQTSQTITVPVAAGTTSPVNLQGNRFYVIATNGPVNIKPYSGASSGAYNQFNTAQGTWGLANNFTNLELQNPNSFPIIVVLWVGFDDFRNDQLTLINSQFSQVAYPTYPVASAATTIAINDLSGTIFVDINGKQWGALQRMAIQIFNLATAVNYLVYKAGGSGVNPAIASCPARLPISLPIQGNYAMASGSAIDAIVSEIYYSVPV
jgi:hypothetical protein